MVELELVPLDGLEELELDGLDELLLLWPEELPWLELEPLLLPPGELAAPCELEFVLLPLMAELVS